MPNYCFITIKKIKSMRHLGHCYQHNFRTSETKNAQPELADDNMEFIPEAKGYTYQELWDRRVNGLNNIRRRSNSVLAYELIMTVSNDQVIDVQKWAADNRKFLQDYFGTENVLSMQLHLDETGNAHIHAIVIPIDEKGHLNARRFTGGPAVMRAFQDRYAEAMKVHGLERGLEGSVARHNDIKRFYTALNHAAQEKLPPQKENESLTQYHLRIQDLLQERNLAHFREKLQWQRELIVERTKLKVYKKKMKKADQLYQVLMEKFQGDVGLIEREFSAFIRMEKLLPQNEIWGMFHQLSERHQLSEPILDPTELALPANDAKEADALEEELL